MKIVSSKVVVTLILIFLQVGYIEANYRNIDTYLNMWTSRSQTNIEHITKITFRGLSIGFTHYKYQDSSIIRNMFMLAPKVKYKTFSIISFLYWNRDVLNSVEAKGLINLPKPSIKLAVGGYNNRLTKMNSYYGGFLYGDRNPNGGAGLGLLKSDGSYELRWQVWKTFTDLPIFIGVRRADAQYLAVVSKPSERGVVVRNVLFYSDKQKDISFWDFIVGKETRNGYYNLKSFDSWYFLHDSKLVDSDCMSNGDMSPFKYLIPPVAWRLTQWGVEFQEVKKVYKVEGFVYVMGNTIYIGGEVLRNDSQNERGIYFGVVDKNAKFHFDIRRYERQYQFGIFARIES